MKSSPLPYWIRQLEEVLLALDGVQKRGWPFNVMVKVKKKGRIDNPQVYVFPDLTEDEK